MVAEPTVRDEVLGTVRLLGVRSLRALRGSDAVRQPRRGPATRRTRCCRTGADRTRRARADDERRPRR